MRRLSAIKDFISDHGARLRSVPCDKPRRAEPRKYNFLPNFDVNPAAMPLKKFLGTKEYSESDKYLVVSLWLMRHGGMDPFTPDHVFTCFRAMDWKQQIDFTQPIRLMKSKKSYFENPVKGSWRLTAGVGVPAAEAALAKS